MMKLSVAERCMKKSGWGEEMKKSDLIFEIVILVIVIALIVIIGAHERGYYCVASEPFVAVFGIIFIIERRRKNGRS